MFMCPCIVIIFQYIIPTSCTSHSLFYLTTPLHVSRVTITHFQEHKTTVNTASGNLYTVIDRVKFTDKEYRQTRLKLQLLNNYVSNHMKTKQINTPPTTNSNQFQYFHDSSRQQYRYVHHSLIYRTYCIFRRIYIIQQL